MAANFLRTACALLAFVASPGFAEEPAFGAEERAPAPPPAPPNHILDEARIFSEEQEAVLGQRLLQAKQNHGIEVFVAAYSFLLGEEIDDRAREVAKAWLTEPKGVVVVYERGTEKMTFAASTGLKEALSREDLLNVFSRAAAIARGSNDNMVRSHAERIDVACAEVVDGLVSKILTRTADARRFQMRHVYFIAAFLCILTAICMIGWTLQRLGQKKEMEETQSFRFPPVVVGQRFGAPFGGGSVGELSFGEVDAAPPGEEA